MDQATKPKPRDLRIVIGIGLAAILVLVGLKATSDDKKSSTTTVPTLAPTTLQPMVTTSPYHETPVPAEWSTWLTANSEPFAKARASLAASEAGKGPTTPAEFAEVETWADVLLARPIPADPIGQRLTASLTALRGVAVAHQRPLVTTDPTDDTNAFDAEIIKGNTLLQSALADLTALGVLGAG